jgi:predicted P-loop ATPase
MLPSLKTSQLLNSSDRAKVTPKLPHLWVTDIIAAQPLEEQGTFAGIFSSEDVVPTDAQGEHILCLDPDTTPEVEWKMIAYELIKQGCRVRVCELSDCLESYLKKNPAADVAVHIVAQEIRWEDWARQFDTRLDLVEALGLAELVLLNIQGKQQSGELNRLRLRVAGSREMSEYTWGKEIEKLKANLERMLALPASNRSTQSSRYKKRYQAVKELWDGKLRLNTLKQQVELDGEPLDLDFVRADLCVELDIDIPKEEAIEIILKLARENQYCPIIEYLEKVEATYPEPNINFANLTSQLLGTSDPLHTVYLKRHLIGSVVRALNPGCKMDTALILQGDQGIGKSSFFRALYGDDFFDDTMAESSDKDELMKLHQHWAVEWAEFETQLSRKGYSRLKQFMSTKVDNYRAPYARATKPIKRRSVLVGSTNELEFLNDPSGDRRYWVIPLGDSMNLSLTEQLRDQIWAAAVAAYRAGEQWHLTSEEKKLADEANQPFRTSDTWEDYILAYVQDRQFVTISEVLTKALELDPSKQDKGSQMRASSILRRLGWDKGKCWVAGTWKRGWLNPDRSTDPPLEEVDRSNQKVDRCQEVNEINGFSHTDPPDPPFDQHLAKKADELEVETEESLNQGGSVDRVESLEACKTEVSPTDPPQKNQWGRIQDMGADTNKLVCVVEPADENGNMLVSEDGSPEFKMPAVPYFGTLKLTDFVALTQNECLALGLRWVGKKKTTAPATRPAPYSAKNLPKKGDAIRSGSGKVGRVSLTRSSNPRYEITWADNRVMGYDLKDLETLDIRKEP